jgi:hypothetical protein
VSFYSFLHGCSLENWFSNATVFSNNVFDAALQCRCWMRCVQIKLNLQEIDPSSSFPFFVRRPSFWCAPPVLFNCSEVLFLTCISQVIISEKSGPTLKE